MYKFSCIKVVPTKFIYTKFSKVILAAFVLGLCFIFGSWNMNISSTHKKIKKHRNTKYFHLYKADILLYLLVKREALWLSYELDVRGFLAQTLSDIKDISVSNLPRWPWGLPRFLLNGYLWFFFRSVRPHAYLEPRSRKCGNITALHPMISGCAQERFYIYRSKTSGRDVHHLL